MNKTAFLHVGMHKTGSTSLQTFLNANSETLAAHRLHIPSFNKKTTAFHRNLCNELKKSPGFNTHAGTFKDLENILSRANLNIIISWENFSIKIADPKILDWLALYFKKFGFQLHIIGYVRDHPAYFNSMYTQDIKRFRTDLNFSEYLAKELSNPKHDPAYIFKAALNNYSLNTTILSFEDSIGNGLEQSFLDIILPNGYDRNGFSISRIANESPNAVAVCIARIIHRTLKENNRLYKINAKARKNLYYQILQAMTKQRITDTKFCGLNKTNIQIIQSHFNDGAEKFSRQAWGIPWKRRDYTQLTYNEIDLENSPRLLVATLEKLAISIIDKFPLPDQ